MLQIMDNQQASLWAVPRRNMANEILWYLLAFSLVMILIVQIPGAYLNTFCMLAHLNIGCEKMDIWQYHAFD